MTLQQDFFGDLAAIEADSVRRYFSGVLSPAIWEGHRRAAAPVCVAASECGGPALERICAYAASGGDILLDSGAFVYRDSPEKMPWTKVMTVYRRVLDAATRPLTVIAPDVVGDQQATLEVLRTHGATVAALCAGKHRILLPVQRGPISVPLFVKAALQALDTIPDGLAIPCKASAFPASELAALKRVDPRIPRRLHFLGISQRVKELAERVRIVRAFWLHAEISCDAVEFRAQVGQNKPITRFRREALDKRIQTAHEGWDETEDFDVHDATLNVLAKEFPDLDEADLIDVACSGYGVALDLRHFHERTEKEQGPAATADSIAWFAERRMMNIHSRRSSRAA